MRDRVIWEQHFVPIMEIIKIITIKILFKTFTFFFDVGIKFGTLFNNYVDNKFLWQCIREKIISIKQVS